MLEGGGIINCGDCSSSRKNVYSFTFHANKEYDKINRDKQNRHIVGTYEFKLANAKSKRNWLWRETQTNSNQRYIY